MIDNGANVLNCERENNFNDHTCLSHNSHLLLVNDGIGECVENDQYLQKLLRRLKKIYKYFKYKKQYLIEFRHNVVAEVIVKLWPDDAR